MSKPKSKAGVAEGKISASLSEDELDLDVRSAIAEHARREQAVRDAAADHAATLPYRDLRHDGDAAAATIELLLACEDDETFERLRGCFGHRVSAADDGVLDMLAHLIRCAVTAIHSNSEPGMGLLREAMIAFRDGARNPAERLSACRRAVESSLLVVKTVGNAAPRADLIRRLQAGATATPLMRELAGYDARFAQLAAPEVCELLADAMLAKRGARFVLARLMHRCGAFDVEDLQEAQAEIDDAHRTEKQTERRLRAKIDRRSRR